ncbi:MAG: helix-turn-helix domain protein [Anaerosolibacter sp.]|uniref:helix-turn-helix transcriptional regulator n=1 Tax=Anaerosolibacter sp. TaxID=1872527 RepID=UPI002636BDC9|nr:helix-turn-helix transcriptional regulator [Anaerosolibacter sp.]MDF2548784.1 helix-turn-helix domain protein [Anaerosolibacter sp.]
MNTLKQIRESKKLTQKELADLVNLSQETISQYENGKRRPNIIIARKIADIFGISLDNIFFGSNISN